MTTSSDDEPELVLRSITAELVNSDDLFKIANHRDRDEYVSTMEEYSYSRGFRHGLVAGVRKALKHPHFYYEDDVETIRLEDSNIAFEDGYSQGFAEGRLHARDAQQRLLLDLVKAKENLAKAQATVRELEEKLRTEVEDAYNAGRLDASDWNLT